MKYIPYLPGLVGSYSGRGLGEVQDPAGAPFSDELWIVVWPGHNQIETPGGDRDLPRNWLFVVTPC